MAVFFTTTIRQSFSSTTPEVLGTAIAFSEKVNSLSLSPENILWYVNQERAKK